MGRPITFLFILRQLQLADTPSRAAAINNADAIGGAIGQGLSAGVGGNATATTTTTAVSIAAESFAVIDGRATGNVASATSTASGMSGTSVAQASTEFFNFGDAAYDFEAGASSTLAGATGAPVKAVDRATAAEHGTMPTFDKSSQAVAQIVGLPSAAGLAAALSANPTVAGSFLASIPSFFAMGELGGSYETGGHGQETVTTVASLLIDPSKVQNPGELVLAFYGNTAIGAAATATSSDLVSIEIDVQGGNKQTESISPYNFGTDIFPLGSLSSLGQANNGPFQVTIKLTESLHEAGSGFYTNFIIGDPPVGTVAATAPGASASPTSNHTSELATALFDGFFGPAGSGTPSHSVPPVPPTIAADSFAGGTHPHAHA